MNNYNPYFVPPMKQYLPNYQPTYPQTYAPQYQQMANQLQGKTVDSMEVVKATEIPLDGTVSYFPLTNGTAIVTKQLMQDGTSKMIVYKPITEDTNVQEPKYITEEDLEEKVKNLNNKEIKDMKEEIKTIKRKLEDLTDDIKDKKEK
jgi:hypothetical protein